MKNETQFLIEIANQFGKDAQNILDFVAKTGNLEKAAKALAGAGKPTVSVAPPTIACPERSDLDKLPDGVYFIAGATEGEVNTKTYAKYDHSMTAAPFPAKYIGVKLGHRTVAVALEDLPGDNNGWLQLLPRKHTSPKTSEHYSYDKNADKYKFNAFEDFDGQANTARLKGYGCTIDLPEGEWIPSMGELALLMMHASKVNRAIKLAGGEPIRGWRWSSTEHSQTYTWYVYFSDGSTNFDNKYSSCAVRAVSTF